MPRVASFELENSYNTSLKHRKPSNPALPFALFVAFSLDPRLMIFEILLVTGDWCLSLSSLVHQQPGTTKATRLYVYGYMDESKLV